MGNDVLYLCSTTSALRNLCLKIIAHSVTVAYPLRLVINERNKCVTSFLAQWWSPLSNDHKFLTHVAPLFKFLSIRWDENKFFWRFIFRVLRIYDDLIFEQLSAKCMARMRSTCGHVSVFLRMFWPLVLHFSLLFPFFYIFSLFCFYSRVCFSFEFPFFVLRFLVSSLCFFFSSSSMVDYSALRVDCPSVVFFFAHFGCYLSL